MRDYIELRAIEVGKYIIDSKATVRKTATKFGVSKSTVHKDLTERLPQIDHHLADEVRDILDYLHHHGIYYLDVKPQNLICDKQKHLHLIDTDPLHLQTITPHKWFPALNGCTQPVVFSPHTGRIML